MKINTSRQYLLFLDKLKAEKNKMKPKKIENLKGILCKSIDGEFFFRTYNEDGTFDDYEIFHNDLEIQILDDDAYIYKKGEDLYIDYSPKTLGHD